MFKKIEEKLNHPLICAIAKGISIAVVLLFGLMAVAFAILALAASVWWIIGFVIAAIACGAFAGITSYLWDEW